MRKPTVMGGSGNWGSYVDCREYRVMLHETREQAEAAVRFVNLVDCGGSCRGNHWAAEVEG